MNAPELGRYPSARTDLHLWPRHPAVRSGDAGGVVGVLTVPNNPGSVGTVSVMSNPIDAQIEAAKTLLTSVLTDFVATPGVNF